MSRARRTWLILGGVAVLVTLVVAVWFQPQKLFIDDRVSEVLPTVTAPSSPSTDGDGTAGAPVPDVRELATGSFISRDHTTTGSVRVVELSDGGRFVRLENLATDNGPDLYVYLSTTPADGDESAFDDEFVNLGRLKGNLGDQNYELPTDVSVGDWASVVIWCDRFNAAFGAANLISGKA